MVMKKKISSRHGNGQWELYVDGACSGNPGEAGIGIVIKESGKRIKAFSKSIGEATNNIAEYLALIYALQEAIFLKAGNVKVHTDSELMVKQITGFYKIKNQILKLFFGQVQHLIEGFQHFELHHISRTKNSEADQLAKAAISHKIAKPRQNFLNFGEESTAKKQVKVVASLFENIGEESPSSVG